MEKLKTRGAIHLGPKEPSLLASGDKGQPTIPGQSYPLDDDLILWLTKALMKEKIHG